MTAHLPGIGHTLKKYSKVLIRGRGPRDLPGVGYSCIRGVLDFIGLDKKKRRRSIYGSKPVGDYIKIMRKKYRKYLWTSERRYIYKDKYDKLLVKYNRDTKIFNYINYFDDFFKLKIKVFNSLSFVNFTPQRFSNFFSKSVRLKRKLKFFFLNL